VLDVLETNFPVRRFTTKLVGYLCLLTVNMTLCRQTLLYSLIIICASLKNVNLCYSKHFKCILAWSVNYVFIWFMKFFEIIIAANKTCHLSKNGLMYRWHFKIYFDKKSRRPFIIRAYVNKSIGQGLDPKKFVGIIGEISVKTLYPFNHINKMVQKPPSL